MQLKHQSAPNPHSKRPDARIDNNARHLEIVKPALEIEQRDLVLDGELALVESLLASLVARLVDGVKQDADEPRADGHGLGREVWARR